MMWYIPHPHTSGKKAAVRVNKIARMVLKLLRAPVERQDQLPRSSRRLAPRLVRQGRSKHKVHQIARAERPRADEQLSRLIAGGGPLQQVLGAYPLDDVRLGRWELRL